MTRPLKSRPSPEASSNATSWGPSDLVPSSKEMVLPMDTISVHSNVWPCYGAMKTGEERISYHCLHHLEVKHYVR